MNEQNEFTCRPGSMSKPQTNLTVDLIGVTTNVVDDLSALVKPHDSLVQASVRPKSKTQTSLTWIDNSMLCSLMMFRLRYI